MTLTIAWLSSAMYGHLCHMSVRRTLVSFMDASSTTPLEVLSEVSRSAESLHCRCRHRFRFTAGPGQNVHRLHCSVTTLKCTKVEISSLAR